MENTPSAERIHISFFGKRNAGKSSLVNAVTGQNLSVVSDVLGTTTDPVKKAMELLPLGPVVIIDTPGFDDEGTLGEMRVEKTKEILSKTHIAVLVCDNNITDKGYEEFASLVKEKNIPYIIAHNKSDLMENVPETKGNEIWVSATENINIDALKNLLGDFAKNIKISDKPLLGDLVTKEDIIILVTPIDESAPKGRLILPQQQTIRDILDNHCICMVCQTENLKSTIDSLKQKPKMIITDSQAFGPVSKIVPTDIPLTSFSILFARYKGDLLSQVKGAAMLSKLNDGDTILISEGCTHHRQCGDIGTVKLPNWIKEFSGADIKFDFTSGGEFPKDLKKYKLIVHCGACMLNSQEMKSRLELAKEYDIPMTNYGVAIAHTKGILKRSLEIFPDCLKILE